MDGILHFLSLGEGKRKKGISPACSQKRKKNKGKKTQKSRDSTGSIEVRFISPS